MRRIIAPVIIAGLTCLGLSACTPAPNESQPTVTVTVTVTAASDTPTPVGDVTSTLTLKDHTLICGINVCDGAALLAVKVTVSGSSVAVQVCQSQSIDSDDVEAMRTCTGIGGDKQDWLEWTGTLEGSKAIVTDTTIPSKYRWAILIFDADLHAAAFISPDNCERLDGTRGEINDEGIPYCV